MRSVSVRLADLGKVTIPIGFVGENLHTQVRIDCFKLFEDYPNAVPGLTVKSPVGDAYPAVVTRDGDYVVWEIEDSDLVNSGNGEIQLSFFVDEIIAKSYISRIRIEKSIVPTGDVPTPIENWIDEANEKLAEVEKWDDVTAEATTIEPGEPATAEIVEESGHNKFVFGLPKGEEGEPGVPGFSPVVVVTDIVGGHRISVTDANGTQTFNVMDGEKGDTGNGIESAVLNQDYTLTLNFTDGTHYTTPSIRGAKGENGDTGNGIASVTLNQDYTLTITYTNGQSTTTASIRGEKGETGATPIISIGTVTTLSPGSDATATMDTTDPEHPVLSLGIPEGEPGEVTEAELTAVAESKADIIHDTASGTIATFPDGADSLPMEVTVEIVPVQDLHGQESPYPAGGGKNKIEAVGSWNIDGNGTVADVVGYTAFIAKITQGQTYTISKNGVSAIPQTYGFYATYPNVGAIAYDGQRVIPTSATFTAPIDGYILARMATSIQTEYQIELGSSASSYVPYVNVCPISGWDSANITGTGKNLAGMTYGDTVPSISTGEMVSYNGWSSDFIPVDTAKKYVVSLGETASARYILFYDKNKTYLGYEAAWNVSGYVLNNNANWSNTKYVKTRWDAAQSATNSLQLEFGTYASSYEPFGKTYPIPFPQTVYGGTVKVNKDGSRKLIADMAIVDLSNLTWTERWTGQSLRTMSNGADSIPYKQIQNVEMIAENYRYGGTTDNAQTALENPDSVGTSVWLYFRSDNPARSIYCVCGLNETPSGKICYKLATPIEIDLTDSDAIESLLGVNNVWADCGSVIVNYPCDTKLYIDKKIAELQAIILEN